MKLIEIAWNGPLLMQHGDPETKSNIAQALEQSLRTGPEEPRQVLEELFKSRATKYANDPRLATVTIVDDGAGDFKIRAEASILG